MNKDNAKDFLPLVQALAEGKIIQVKSAARSGWSDLDTCDFQCPASHYRVKPEKKKGWLNIFPGYSQYLFPTRKEADKHAEQAATNGVWGIRIACIEIEWEEGQGLEPSRFWCPKNSSCRQCFD